MPMRHLHLPSRAGGRDEGRGRLLGLAAGLLSVFLLPAVAYAQLGTMSGLVTDAQGGVLPGVTITAASDALIEGSRTSVTGGEGRYTIVQLRPGVYTVTFVLPGFATVIQEETNVSSAGTITVNAQMQVGGLEETITVTGEAPTVDVTTTTRAAVLSADIVDALPSDRNYLGLARLIPGTTAGGDGGRENNIGGSSIGEVGGDLSVHGSRENDQRVTLNGVPTQTLQAGGALGGQTPDAGAVAEVTIEHTGVSAELATGGLRINFVPRDGGNTFSSSIFLTGARDNFQGDNVDQELLDAGLVTPTKIDYNYDLNFAAGGPLAQNKVWFWASVRRQEAKFFSSGRLASRNAFDANNFLNYDPLPIDQGGQGIQGGDNSQTSLRITWQASARNKFAGTYKYDRWCTCPSINSSEAPEAAEDFRFPRLSQEHLEWTSPISNNLLVEAVGLHLFERWGNMHPHQSEGPLHSFSDNPAAIAAFSFLIPVHDNGGNFDYGINRTFNNTLVPNYAGRAAATYVTGTHNVKVGMTWVSGFLEQTQYQAKNYQYRLRNGVPESIRLEDRPRFDRSNQDRDLGFYLQDTITLDRFTIGAATRFDQFKTSYPDGTIPATEFAPDRTITFAGADILDWNDITYRSSLVWDARGDGRTAVKLTANKYLEGQTLNGIGRAGHPVARLAGSTTRTWNDTDGDLFPDCDLVNPAANGECLAFDNRNFGTLRPAQSYSDDLLTGFGNREANWEYAVGVQQELMRGVSLDVGYFRRDWQNLQVRDNLNLTSADFFTFDLQAPVDSRLEDASGQTLTNVRILTPAGQAKGTNNINLRAKEVGDFTESWQGVDLNLNARFDNGLVMQAGTSTGRVAFNDCDLQTAIPELALNRAGGFCERAGAVSDVVQGLCGLHHPEHRRAALGHDSVRSGQRHQSAVARQ